MPAVQVLVLTAEFFTSSCPHQPSKMQKSHQKALATCRSSQAPAINRPLIGGCNRIQFISRSDGLTFIITRGSACHELWAIHSLVEINCISSAHYCVLRTRPALLGSSSPPPRCKPSFREPLSSADWAGGATFISNFWASVRGSVSLAKDQPKALPPLASHCSSPRPALVWIQHSSFRGSYWTQWGLGGEICAVLLLSSSH